MGKGIYPFWNHFLFWTNAAQILLLQPSGKMCTKIINDTKKH